MIAETAIEFYMADRLFTGKLNEYDTRVLLTSVIMITIFCSIPLLDGLVTIVADRGLLPKSLHLLLGLFRLLLVIYIVFSLFLFDLAK